MSRFLLRRDRVVNAGAGTGKTHALVTQYLHLATGLTSHAEVLAPRQICALTFTDKAAGEMRARVEARARRAAAALLQRPEAMGATEALAQVEPDLVESARVLGQPAPGIDRFRELLAQLPGAPIGTFHSFAANLLRRQGVAAGVDPDFALLDEAAARDLLTDATERVVLDALAGHLGDELQTAAALLTTEFGFRGAAGRRGSTGLVEALGALHAQRAEEGRGAAGLADSYRPEVLTAALAELRDRLVGGLRQLGQISEQLGATSADRAAQAAAYAGLVDAALAAADLDERSGPLLTLLTQIQESIKNLRAPKSDPELGLVLKALVAELRVVLAEVPTLLTSFAAVPLARSLEALLAPVQSGYALAKQAQGSLDFADLLIRARDLLRDDAQVRAAARARFAVFLVDEFQDTNPLQAELIGLLTGLDGGSPDEEPDPDAPGRLYLVGDRKQSIYEFRGADVAAYAALCDRLLLRGAEAETLSVSRRSVPGVLRLVNALFARVMHPEQAGSPGPPPPFFVVWDERRDALTPLPELAESGVAVELIRAEPKPEPESQPEREEEPAEAAVPEAEGAGEASSAVVREAQLVARRIRALNERGTPYRHVAILLRRFTHLLRYTAALKRAGVPHYVVRGRGFYQASEILDVAAFFTLLEDEGDRAALITVLRSPLCGLADETLVKLHLRGELTLPALVRGYLADAGGVPSMVTPEPAELSELSEPLDLDMLPPLELLGAEATESAARVPAAAELSIPVDERARLARLVRLLRALRLTGERVGPAACLRALLDGTDYAAVLAAGDDGDQQLANLQRLGERALAFEARGGLRAFTRTLRLLTDPQFAQAEGTGEPAAQLFSEADDVVRVMTVHQAKGLEFPVVIVAGCAGREPSRRAAIGYDRDVGLGLRIAQAGERVDTLASLRVKAAHAARSSAESARLFYVAATRAKERLIFAGESARRTSRSSWLSHVEALLDSPADGDASTAPLVSVWTPAAQSELEAGASLGADESGPSEPAVDPLAAVARALSAPPLQSVEVYAERVAELLACPRRYHLAMALGLGELGEQAPVALGGRVPLVQRALGTELAASLLAEVDFSASGAGFARELEARLASAGHDPEQPAVAELLTRLVRFAATRFPREALGSPEGTTGVWRAVPFALRLPGERGAPILRGRLDVLRVVPASAAGAGTVAQVLTYRYAYAPEPEDAAAAESLRRELALLGWVARRLVPAAEAVQVGVCFLREASPEPHWHEVPAAVAQHLAEEVAAAAVELAPAAVLQLPVLPLPECTALGCGFRRVCHGSSG